MSGILPSAATLPPSLATPPPSDLRGARAARDFEACLIASLLQSLEKTFGELGRESQMPGGDDYSYLGTQALAQGIAERGGFGIAAMIARDLAKHEGKGGRDYQSETRSEGTP